MMFTNQPLNTKKIVNIDIRVTFDFRHFDFIYDI